MAEEALELAKAKITDKGIEVSEDKAVNELEKRGYGEREKNKLILKDYEALYLCQINKLIVEKGNKVVSFDKLVEFSLKRDPDAWTSFLIYRDLRTRGYVVKEGFGFGTDFRVYDRGEYGKKPARYVIFGLNEGKEIRIKDIEKVIEQIVRMGKEPVIAVIERRGEVIYYKLSKARFKKFLN
jgi:tRNA-intron endonuclease